MAPRRVSRVISNAVGLEALRRMADAGLVTLSALTPSDALHVLGKQSGWSAEAAELGARLLAIEERNARGLRSTNTAQSICERILEQVIRQSAQIVLNTALAHDPGIETPTGSWGQLGDRLFDEVSGGRTFANLITATLELNLPLVAIGAPAGAYYPEVARRLGATLSIPRYASVCNAVGAIAGIVSQRVEVLVDQTTFNVFRVHDPAGHRDFASADTAIAHAKLVAVEFALAAARRVGAADPEVVTTVAERRAHGGLDADYLAEARVTATATGRPVAGTPDAVA